MSKDRLLCDKWEFSKNPIDTAYEDAKDWKAVDLPHDWLIYQVHDLYETSTGWYRRVLNVSPKEGRRYALRFEGVYMDSRVYVNGALAGEWKYGYSTFEHDITGLLKDGDNLVTVRVDYRSPNSRWYSGAGIYRKVWFKEYADCHIVPDGVYITSDVSGKVSVTVEAERPDGAKVDGLSVRCVLFDGEKAVADMQNDACAADRTALPDVVIKEGRRYSVNKFNLNIDSPELWDIGNPHMYRCVAELLKDGEVIDTAESAFGLKEVKLDPDKGFFLNGKHVKLHGCCLHHDLGSLGAAVNVNAIRRQLEKVRELGINAIRTTHNMPAVELMELADEMGFLVVSEGFDMWERHKTENDYADFFPEWLDRDVASWVRRDRNHPSLIGWSIGNEIYDTHADERGQEITSMFVNRIRLHDPDSNGFITIGSNFMQWENARKCADILKIAGYNYAERLYKEQHEQHPDWVIYGSETSSVLQSRGIYHFPASEPILTEDDEQCSALGNTTVGWGAKNVEACIIPDRDADYCMGQFIWTGIDYIGEPTPYATKNSYFGQIDTAGFLKDSAYIFKSAWTDYKTAPFVHLYPYWDFTEGQKIDVRAATNAPLVKLFQNGELICEKRLDQAHGKEFTLDTNIEYSKGKLTAIAYDENGSEIARDTQSSFGDAAQIRLSPENTEIRANGTDLIFLDIDAYDKNGIFTANANNRVFVDVSGAGRLIGLDNGDSTDYDEYKGTSRRLFSGKLLAIIAATDKPGEINVKVTSKGLPDAGITFTALPADVPEGVSCGERNSLTEADCGNGDSDVPVRRIEFSSDSREFTPERTEITVSVTALPLNASYGNDIEYRLVNYRGIESQLAEIKNVSDGKVTLRCKGDGEFFLRALCKNGTDKYHIISSIPLRGEGLGASFFDPYSFVAGGLFSVQSGNIIAAHEKGAQFPKGNTGGWFGFENVDFGSVGSDTVTVPIATYDDAPVPIEFYDGIPGEGGELIGKFEYYKPQIWMQYIPETFKLDKTLRGVHTFVIKSTENYNVQGFSFEKFAKERAELRAADADNVFGDRFTKNADDVTGIGNNVMLLFGVFDFDEYPLSKIVITGRSKLPINSIHVIFGDNGNAPEKRVLAEFAGADEYVEREFAIEGVTGRREVSFAFLPGSDFDFKSFRFE